MTLMRREKLRNFKMVSHKMDFRPDIRLFHTLLDHGLTAWDKMDEQQARIEELESEIRSLRVQAEETRIRNERLLNGVDLSDPYFE